MAEKFVLGKNDLDHLIRGGELRTTHGTCLVLSDIGYDQTKYLAERLGHVPHLVGKIRKVHSMVLEKIPNESPLCSAELRRQGKQYLRTCPVHGLLGGCE